jgi:predicted Zn-dependent peptidase
VVIISLNRLGFVTPHQRIEALTMEDVRKVAVSVLNTNRLAVSIVIPAAKKP